MKALSSGVTEAVLVTAPKRHYPAQWILLIATLLLLGGQMGYDQFQTLQHIEAEAKNRLENHSLVVVEELERWIKSINIVLKNLRYTAPTELKHNNGPVLVRRELATLAQALEGVRTLALFDVEGNIIACNRPELLGQNFAQREYFQSIRQQPNADALYVSQPFVTALGAYTLTLGRMVVGPSGEFAGVVTATVDSENAALLLKSIHAGNETTLAIIHDVGEILTLIPEHKDVPPGFSVAKPNSLFERHKSSGQLASFITGTSSIAGTQRLISIRTVQPPALNMTKPLFVTAARHYDEVFSPWQAQAKIRALIFFVISLLSALALFFYQRRQSAFDQQIQQKEKERQRSLLVLQRFIDHLPGTAYVKDADSRTLMANRAFETLLGINPASMIGKTSAEFFPGEFGEKIIEDDRKVLEHGNTVVIEESFNGRDYESTKFVIDDGSGHRHLGGITMDVTQRKHAERDREAQLQEVIELNHKLAVAEESMRRLSTAVEQSPASIVITDLDAQIIFVNQAFSEASGYSAEEAIGQNPRILHSGETPAATYDTLWPTLAAGHVWRGEFINQRKDGSRFLELATISPVRDSSGQVTHYVAVKEDITEQRRNEIELLNHRQHLERLVELRTNELSMAKLRADNANRAKSDFLANMSHEIRTPMNAIIGLNYLLRQSELKPDQIEKLNKIASAAEHLLHIINDILDLSKIEAGKMVLERYAFSPAEVLENIGALIRDQVAGKGLRLEINTGDLPAFVFGDKTRLHQVLLNLASNAIKFTEQGFISFTGEDLGRDGDEITCRFSVTDSGIGIATEQTQRLFNAFEQLDSSTTRYFGGSGLGLAIARHLAELMGGKIGVESTPGIGSRFWITARFGVASEAPPPTPEPTHLEKNQLKGRILVAEDDPINREIASEMLRATGAEVVMAENGLVAVNCFNSDKFDLVLMDIQMPVLDGVDATRQIRALPHGASVPIVAMTANVFANEQAEYRNVGMVDFLPKPVRPEALFALLAKYLPRSEATPRKVVEASGVTPAPSLSTQAMSEQLSTLAELLSTGSIQASHLFDALSPSLQADFPAECAQMRLQINRFNFDAALPLLEKIQDRLR
ncbi:MAG: PAS domain S-box protein [Rhodocyclaceae bacterium]|nr:PAS domain S-box protein [Rhodocyclaceae bacterium]